MFRKIIAFLLILIFIPVFIINVFVFTSKTSFFDPLYYKNQFSKNHIYETMINDGLPVLSELINKGNGELDQVIKSSDLLEIANNTINPAWLEKQFNSLFDGINGYILSRSSELNIKIDLEEIKPTLAKEVSEKLPDLFKDASSNLENMPTCTDKEMQELSKKTGNDRVLNCIPSGFSRELMVNYTKDVSNSSNIENELLKNIPNEFDLGNTINKSNFMKYLTLYRTNYQYVQDVMYIILALAVFLLALIGFLIFKPISSVCRWLANTILIPAVILLSGSLIIKFLMPKFLSIYPNNLPSGLIKLILNATQALFNPFISTIIYINASIIVIIIIIHIVISIKNNKKIKPVNNDQLGKE